MSPFVSLTVETLTPETPNLLTELVANMGIESELTTLVPCAWLTANSRVLSLLRDENAERKEEKIDITSQAYCSCRLTKIVSSEWEWQGCNQTFIAEQEWDHEVERPRLAEELGKCIVSSFRAATRSTHQDHTERGSEHGEDSSVYRRDNQEVEDLVGSIGKSFELWRSAVVATYAWTPVLLAFSRQKIPAVIAMSAASATAAWRMVVAYRVPSAKLNGRGRITHTSTSFAEFAILAETGSANRYAWKIYSRSDGT